MSEEIKKEEAEVVEAKVAPMAQPTQQQQNQNQNTYKAVDASSMGWNILSLLFPIVGLIVYLMWKSEFPIKAKAAGKFAIIGCAISVVFTIINAALGLV